MQLPQGQAPQLLELPAGPSLDRLRGPVEVPLFEIWQILVMAAVGLALVAAVIFLIWRLLIKRSRQAPILDPKEAALQEIESAIAHTAEDSSRFVQLITSALRRYYESGLDVPTQGQTTQQLIQALEKSSTTDKDADRLLTELLLDCDQIKFARQSLTDEKREALGSTAQRILSHYPLQQEGAQS